MRTSRVLRSSVMSRPALNEWRASFNENTLNGVPVTPAVS